MVIDTTKQQAITHKIKKFFSDYETRFNKSLLDPPQIDIEGVVDSFTSTRNMTWPESNE